MYLVSGCLKNKPIQITNFGSDVVVVVVVLKPQIEHFWALFNFSVIFLTLLGTSFISYLTIFPSSNSKISHVIQIGNIVIRS